MCGIENIHCFNGRSLGGFNGFIKTLVWASGCCCGFWLGDLAKISFLRRLVTLQPRRAGNLISNWKVAK